MSNASTVATAVRSAIRAARAAGRLKPWHTPAARVAEKLAKALDVPDLPVAELIRLSTELDKMLSRLPLAEPSEPRGGVASDGSVAASGGVGAGDTRSLGVARIVGSGPEVGDTALPA